MDADDLCFVSIAEISSLISSREVSPVDLIDAHLARIERTNGRLNSFVPLLGDEAVAAAADAENAIQSGNYLGPLHGIPIGLKDLYDTAGVFLASSFVPVTAVASTYTVPQSTTIQKAASRQVVSRPQIVSTISTFSQSEPKGDILKETPPPPVVLTPAAPAPTMSAAAGELARNERFAYVGLAILLLLGVLGVYLAPRQKQPE